MGLALITLAVFATLAFAARAQASELLYWDNYGGDPDSIGSANIDGTGGGLLNQGSFPVESPEGMAYDTVSNRLFVPNEAGDGTGQILAINLDGSGAALFTAPGAPIEEPEGIAVDPATRTIYWLNTDGEGSISWAKLDGSAGGVLNVTGTSFESSCCRIAIDPVGERVYWVNEGANPNTINFANLDNTGGGGVLPTTGSTVEPGDSGLAVNNATGRLYYLDENNHVGYANLNGTGGGDVSTGGAVVETPWGLAIDQSIGRLYWANEGNPKGEPKNAFGFVDLNGASSGNISIASTLVGSPQDPVIIKSPTGTGAPSVTRDAKVAAKLTCSTGSWAGDYAGSFVYQAPRTYAYQWTRNGAAVAGATAATLTAKSAGKYACTVTATNQAGSAAQTSAATINVKAAKVKLTTKKKAKANPGQTVKFKVKAVNQGDLKAKKAKVCVKLPKSAKGALKAPKCKSLGGLKGRGKKSTTLKVKVLGAAAGTYKVTFAVKGAAGKAAKSKIVVG